MTHPIANGRECGKCSMCCKVLRIDELQKPAGKWCDHCKVGHGCTIYETRPDVCRTFACAWLMSDRVPEEWYPLRSHMVLSYVMNNGITTITCSVDANHPTAWQSEPFYSHLKNMAHAGLRPETPQDIRLVQVRCKDRVWLLTDESDIDVSRLFYVAKLISRGQYGIELYNTQEAAQARVNELTQAS
jgi:Fe-S-cluster containining protein